MKYILSLHCHGSIQSKILVPDSCVLALMRLTSYMSLGKVLTLSVPQFSHLYNRNENGTYLTGLL